MKASIQVRPTVQSLLFASVALIAVGRSASAQDSRSGAPEQPQATASSSGPEQASVGVEEIVVTAQRREEKLQETPVAVSAFSALALEDRGVTNLSQLGQFTPSLVIQPTNRPAGGGSAIAAYIRGVGTGDYNLPTDPAIGVYIDGVYLARSVGGLLSLPDIQQTEVLRGPQGTLWGRNTLGGAINIVTTQPRLTDEPVGIVEGRVGSYGRKDLMASINGPLVDGKIGGKLSISTLNSDGYGKSLATGQQLNTEHRFIARGALRYLITDDLDLTLYADYTGQHQRPPALTPAQFFAPSALINLYNAEVAIPLDASLGLPAGSKYGPQFLTSNKYDNYARGQLADNFVNGGVSATLVWDVSPALQVKSITAFRDLEAKISVNGSGTPYPIALEQSGERDSQISQEVTFGGKIFDDRLTYLAGAYFFTETGHSSDDLQVFEGLYQATGNSAFAIDTNTFQRMRATSYAAFTQESYAILPSLNLTAGARVNYDQKDYDAFVLAPQLGTVAIPDQGRSPHWASFTPKLGIDWKPTEQAMLYASYAEGFKSGGVSPPVVGLPLQPYSPETLESYEIGAKTEWLDHRLTVNLAAYYSIHDAIQLTTLVSLPNGNIARPVQNGGSADTYGYEAEIVAVPIDRLTLNLAAAYTHDRFTHVSPSVAAAVGAYIGERLPDIPDFNISVGAQYVFQTSLGDVTLRGDFSETGKAQLSIGDPNSYQRAYPMVNARVAFDPASIEGLEVAVEGSNLTNQLYYNYNQTVGVLGGQFVEAGRPRTIFVTARYKF
jgi:iron complex outermembrane recepter protein